MLGPYVAHCIKLICMAVVPEGSFFLSLKMMHKKARKQFAEDKQTKDMDYWNHVLWSDETKLNIFSSDGVKCVCVFWATGQYSNMIMTPNTPPR